MISDYTALRDNPNVLHANTYSVFQTPNSPTLEQVAFYKTPWKTSKVKRAMETIFEGVKLKQQCGTAAYKAYQKQFKGQSHDIIKGMFLNHMKKMGENPQPMRGAR